jgi:hypothetical protein
MVSPLQSNTYCNVLTRTVQYMMNEIRESEGSALSTPRGGGEKKCTAKPVTLLDSCSNDLLLLVEQRQWKNYMNAVSTSDGPVVVWVGGCYELGLQGRRQRQLMHVNL